MNEYACMNEYAGSLQFVFIYATFYTTQLGNEKIQLLPLAQDTPDLHSSIHTFPVI